MSHKIFNIYSGSIYSSEKWDGDPIATTFFAVPVADDGYEQEQPEEIFAPTTTVLGWKLAERIRGSHSVELRDPFEATNEFVRHTLIVEEGVIITRQIKTAEFNHIRNSMNEYLLRIEGGVITKEYSRG